MTLCPFPFMSVDVAAAGTYSLCCDAEPMTTPVRQMTSEEWFNGDVLREVRTMMKNGQTPLACKRCFKNESLGLPSFRQNALKEFAVENYGPFFEQPRLIHLNYRFGNKCNLACLMCHESSSSTVGQEKKRHGEGDWREVQNPIQLQFETLRDIRSVYIGGGEPALSPDVGLLLERLIEVGNTSAEIWVNSNATLPNTELFKKLQNFKKVTIRFSIDGSGQTYELLRYPMSWSKLQASLNEFFTRYPKFDYGIIFTLNVLNIANLPEFLKWWMAHSGPGRLSVLQINDLVFPHYLSASLIDPETKEDVLARLREIAQQPDVLTNEAWLYPVQELLHKLETLQPSLHNRQNLQAELKKFLEKRGRWRGFSPNDVIQNWKLLFA